MSKCQHFKRLAFNLQMYHFSSNEYPTLTPWYVAFPLSVLSSNTPNRLIKGEMK